MVEVRHAYHNQSRHSNTLCFRGGFYIQLSQGRGTVHSVADGVLFEVESCLW